MAKAIRGEVWLAASLNRGFQYAEYRDATDGEAYSKARYTDFDSARGDRAIGEALAWAELTSGVMRRRRS